LEVKERLEVKEPKVRTQVLKVIQVLKVRLEVKVHKVQTQEPKVLKG
jgi:hypothetical protein